MLVLLVLFVVLDRVAVAYAENQAAQQMQSQGFPAKPDVTIKGFPFLAPGGRQALQNDVHITANDVKEGPVTLQTSWPTRRTSGSIPAIRAARSATSPGPCDPVLQCGFAFGGGGSGLSIYVEPAGTT